MEVIGVRFRSTKKIYYFSPNGLNIQKNDNVVVETARGIEFGQTVIGIRDVPEEDIIQPLQKVIRIATPEDEKTVTNNLERQKDAFDKCLKKIEQHQLDMKLVDAEYTFDGTKLVFYFTSDGRVDFRELVKDLATLFRTRIELRQIAVRDETKMLGGLGACGNEICCKKFLGDFASVSIKMAKEQSLSLNPSKISGLCGRLICCLNYEKDFYDEMNQKLPLQDEFIMTPRGQAQVIATYPLKESVRVKVTNPDGSTETTVFHLNDITRIEENIAKQQNTDDTSENDDIDFIPDELAENPDEVTVKARSKAKPYNKRPRENKNVKTDDEQDNRNEQNAEQQNQEIRAKRESKQSRRHKSYENNEKTDIPAKEQKPYVSKHQKEKQFDNVKNESVINEKTENQEKNETFHKKGKRRPDRKNDTQSEQNQENADKTQSASKPHHKNNYRRNKHRAPVNNSENQEKSK